MYRLPLIWSIILPTTFGAVTPGGNCGGDFFPLAEVIATGAAGCFTDVQRFHVSNVSFTGDVQLEDVFFTLRGSDNEVAVELAFFLNPPSLEMQSPGRLLLSYDYAFPIEMVFGSSLYRVAYSRVDEVFNLQYSNSVNAALLSNGILIMPSVPVRDSSHFVGRGFVATGSHSYSLEFTGQGTVRLFDVRAHYVGLIVPEPETFGILAFSLLALMANRCFRRPSCVHECLLRREQMPRARNAMSEHPYSSGHS